MLRRTLATALLVTSPALAYTRVAPRDTTRLTSPAGTPPVCRNSGQSVTCSVDMQYFGGHAISNPKVYAVFWGGGVDAVTTKGVGGFLDTITDSRWIEWLSEYSTNFVVKLGPRQGQEGTDQIIGRGVYAGAFTIAPGRCGAPAGACNITDGDITSELEAQIATGSLPAPDSNTMFMLYFPPGVAITNSTGEQSCKPGGFCAYHGTFLHAQQSTYYGVFPDLGPGSGCDSGCGSAGAFGNLCSASSHELGEAMTDAEVGLAIAANSLAYVGWMDVEQFGQGEIGDMCSQDQVTTDKSGPGCALGSDGCYVVQQLFSRAIWNAGKGDPRTPACIAASSDANDYSLALRPNSVTLTAGASTSVVVETRSGGSAGTLTLSVTAPAGMHASVDKTSIRAGEAANVTLSLDPGAAVHDGLVTVQATGGRAHSAAILVKAVGVAGNPPSVTLTAPANGARLSGTATVSAAATVDPHANGVAALQILLDGAVTRVATSASASWEWDTTKGSNGQHTLVAKVTDGNGNSATSSPAVVTVDNGSSAGSDDFGLQLSPSTFLLLVGAPATIAVATTALGSPGPIMLAAMGPKGISASFSPNPVDAGDTSTLTLTADGSAAAGNAQLTVSGRASGITHTASATFTVGTQTPRPPSPPPQLPPPAASHASCSSISGNSGPFVLGALAALVLRRRRRSTLLDRHAPRVHDGAGEGGQAEHQADRPPAVGVRGHRDGERDAGRRRQSIAHVDAGRTGIDRDVGGAR